MSTPYQLGRLEKVNPRDIWETEAGNFTPWLAQEENLQLLGETIGIELELEAQEQHVGPFRADILCKDTLSNNWVLIENQLERTDHTHLGQLLTYAAGLKAVTIIWIANPFTDEHRAALDWLNEVTNEKINFFGLEVELWRIGDSPAAPKFNIVCSPNEWNKIVTAAATQAESGSLTESKQLQIRYWTAFREYAIKQATYFRTTKPLPQNWMNIAIGRSGFKLNAIAAFYDSASNNWNQHEIRAELVIDDRQHSKVFYAQLEQQKAAIEQEFGEPLIWYNPAEARLCRIYLRKLVNLHDETDWPSQHQWLVTTLDALHQIFAKRIKQLHT